MVINIWTKE